MINIRQSGEGVVRIAGRFTAAEADEARSFLDGVSEPTVLDFQDLEYISSAGLGVLIQFHGRLSELGHGVRLKNLNRNLMQLFQVSGLHMIFEIE